MDDAASVERHSDITDHPFIPGELVRTNNMCGKVWSYDNPWCSTTGFYVPAGAPATVIACTFIDDDAGFHPPEPVACVVVDGRVGWMIVAALRAIGE